VGISGVVRGFVYRVFSSVFLFFGDRFDCGIDIACVIPCDFEFDFAFWFSIGAAGIGQAADVFFRELFGSTTECTDVARSNYCKVGKFRWEGHYFNGWTISVVAKCDPCNVR
jgi:hypothetical protein